MIREMVKKGDKNDVVTVPRLPPHPTQPSYVIHVFLAQVYADQALKETVLCFIIKNSFLIMKHLQHEKDDMISIDIYIDTDFTMCMSLHLYLLTI